MRVYEEGNNLVNINLVEMWLDLNESTIYTNSPTTSIDFCIFPFKMLKSGLVLITWKSYLHSTHDITSMRATSGGVHLRGLASGQLSSEVTSQRWRVVGDTVCDLLTDQKFIITRSWSSQWATSVCDHFIMSLPISIRTKVGKKGEDCYNRTAIRTQSINCSCQCFRKRKAEVVSRSYWSEVRERDWFQATDRSFGSGNSFKEQLIGGSKFSKSIAVKWKIMPPGRSV